MFSVTVIAPPLVTLAYNEAGTNIVDGLGRREAARGDSYGQRSVFFKSSNVRPIAARFGPSGWTMMSLVWVFSGSDALVQRLCTAYAQSPPPSRSLAQRR